MAKITKETINHIANLAELRFNEKDTEKYAEKMERVILYVEKLGELKTDKVEPTSHALNVVGGMQEDIAKKFKNRDGLIENAPQMDGEFFKVPKVI